MDRHAVAGRVLWPPAPASPSGASKPSPISAFDWLPGRLIFDGIVLITASLIYNLTTFYLTTLSFSPFISLSFFFFWFV